MQTKLLAGAGMVCISTTVAQLCLGGLGFRVWLELEFIVWQRLPWEDEECVGEGSEGCEQSILTAASRLARSSLKQFSPLHLQ